MMKTTTAADLRAAIARARKPVYVIAGEIGLHPSHLSALLNEHKPLSEQMAKKILDCLGADLTGVPQ